VLVVKRWSRGTFLPGVKQADRVSTAAPTSGWRARIGVGATGTWAWECLTLHGINHGNLLVNGWAKTDWRGFYTAKDCNLETLPRAHLGTSACVIYVISTECKEGDMNKSLKVGQYFTLPHLSLWTPIGLVGLQWSPTGVQLDWLKSNSNWILRGVPVESKQNPSGVQVESKWIAFQPNGKLIRYQVQRTLDLVNFTECPQNKFV
jgi:hypothetical protein